MRTVELEVRCCCQPTKLYGYLRIPEQYARRGYVVSIPVREAMGEVPQILRCHEPMPAIKLNFVRLQVEEFHTRGRHHLALKYEGEKPPAEKLALLKRLPGFSPV